MGVFNSIQENSNKALDHGKDYVEATQKYYKLKVFQQLSKSFSFITKIAILGGLFFLGLIFLSVSWVLWLSEQIGSATGACLYTALGFFGLTIISYFLRKHIDTGILKKLSKQFFD